MEFETELPNQSFETEEVKLDTVDEDAAIRDLESQILILEETRNRIETSKTVQRAQVQELTDECGFTPHEDCPICSYTEEPSQTNLAVTIEGIWDRTKSILGAIVDKVKEILRKIFEFIDKLIGKYLSHSKNYDKIKKTLKPLAMAREEIIAEFRKEGMDFEKVVGVPVLNEALSQPTHAQSTDSQSKKEKSEYGEAFDRLVEKHDNTMVTWNQSYNDLVHWLFSDTALTDGLSGIMVATQHAFEVMHKKLQDMVALSKELGELKKSNDVRSATDKLNYIAKPIDITPFKAACKLLDPHSPDPHVSSILECAQYLSSVITGLAGSHKLSPLQPQEFIKQYFYEKHHQYFDVIFPAEYIRRQTDKDKALASSLISRVGESDKNGELIRAYQNAATILVQEFNAAQNILFTVASVNQEIHLFMGLALQIFECEINEGAIMAKAKGNERLVKACEEIIAKLRSELKAF